MKENLPTIRLLIVIVSSLAIFELLLLAVMIPSKGAFHWITLGVITISVLYLAILAMKLWRALKGN